MSDFLQFVDLLPDCVCLLSSTGKIIQSNKAFEDVMCAQHPLSLPHDIINEKHRQRFLLGLNNAWHSHSPVVVGSCNSMTLDGGYQPVDWVLKYASGHDGVLATGRLKIVPMGESSPGKNDCMLPLFHCVEFALSKASEQLRRESFINFGAVVFHCTSVPVNMKVNEQLIDILLFLLVDAARLVGTMACGHLAVSVSVEPEGLAAVREPTESVEWSGESASKMIVTMSISFVRKAGSNQSSKRIPSSSSFKPNISASSSMSERSVESFAYSKGEGEFVRVGEMIKFCLNGSEITRSAEYLHIFSFPVSIHPAGNLESIERFSFRQAGSPNPRLSSSKSQSAGGSPVVSMSRNTFTNTSGTTYTSNPSSFRRHSTHTQMSPISDRNSLASSFGGGVSSFLPPLEPLEPRGLLVNIGTPSRRPSGALFLSPLDCDNSGEAIERSQTDIDHEASAVALMHAGKC